MLFVRRRYKMRNYKETHDMVKGVSRFFLTVILVAVMVVVSALPIMTRISSNEAGAAAVNGDGFSGVKQLPLMMEVPPDYPDGETSADVRM